MRDPLDSPTPRRAVSHRRLTLGLVSLALAGCTSMQAVKPTELRSADRPKTVVVTKADGSRLLVKEPDLAGDTLTGLADGTAQRIPLTDVKRIEAREPDATRTRNVALVGLGVGVVSLIAILNQGGAKAPSACYTDAIPPQPIACCIANNTPC